MKKFYLYFPIYDKRMDNLDWESYLELLKLNNKFICYFYFKISLFCNFNYAEIKSLVDSNIYFLI